jgi:serine phosphatase RsbU (regulator of sigma subunit)
LHAFILRIAGLVVIISIFVTAGAWLAINPLVVTPILKLRQDLINVGEAVRKDRDAPLFSAKVANRRDELGDVFVAFRRMLDQIQEAIEKRKGAENSLQQSLKQVEAYSRALNNELEKGRYYQRDFLPKRFPQLPGWEIAAAFFPARQVSGDFYDVFELPKGLVGLVIGDVADKGIGAALYMALLRSLIRIFSGHYQFTSEAESSAPALDVMNQPPSHQHQTSILRAVDLANTYLLKTHGDEGMFASLFFGVLNPSNGRLTYVNAGHEPLFTVDIDGTIKKLNHTGPAIGLLSGFQYRPREVVIKPGVLLVGYTDGVSEARSPFDEFYSRRRLQLMLEAHSSNSAEDTVEMIHAELFNFISDSPLVDDITILALRRSGPEK